MKLRSAGHLHVRQHLPDMFLRKMWLDDVGGANG